VRTRIVFALAVVASLIIGLEQEARAQACTFKRYRVRMVPNPQCFNNGSNEPGCQLTPDSGCTMCNPACLYNGWGVPPGTACPSIKQVAEDVYNCDTDEPVSFGAFPPLPVNNGMNFCPCGPLPSNGVEYTDNSVKPGSYSCETCATSGSSSKEPEMCDGKDQDATAPFDEGCGDGEFCASADKSDGAPVDYTSGRIQSNPMTLYSLPAPEGLPFEYRIVWGSHFMRTTASTRTVNGIADTQPTIHHEDEATHYLGTRWLDNYSDRLFINVFGKPTDTITWQSQNGTVTFSASTGWKSWSGRYELIDRGANPADGFGRWVVRTTDAAAARQVWTFEEFTYTSYGGASYVYTLGRLKRRALLTSNLTNLTGRYGYTINWLANGTIDRAVDTLGRELIFVYDAPPPVGGRTYRRSLRTIQYRAPGGTAQSVVQLYTDISNTVLDRVVRVGQPWWYTRFLYKTFPLGTNCVNCGALLTSVIVPGPNRPLDAGQNPVIPSELQAMQSWEIELEGHEFAPSPSAAEIMVAVGSRYPGRRFGYQWSAGSATQLDLKQPGGSCASGCATGYGCWSDGTCYVANVFTHDPATRVPTGMSALSGSSSQTFSRVFDSLGRPRRVTDASNTRTTYGYDTSGRVRCMVRGDNDDEAFANPGDPNNSACAGPTGSQAFQTNYGASSITKTFPSLLSGNVTEAETLDATTLLPTSFATAGKTRDINGTTTSMTRTSTRAYDSIGRETEVNGPLTDSVALDKSTTSYYTTYDPAWPNNFGRVHQRSSYVGTSVANTPLTTTYSEYDVWGIPHRVTFPAGDYLTAVLSEDPANKRQIWTVTHFGAGGAISSATVIKLNYNGAVLSVTDPDSICTTYEYTDATGYLGAVTKMRRSSSSDSCGVLPIPSTGEVEIRAYMNGDPDRLQSVTRQMNGVTNYSYSGFVYDRDRKLVSVSTLDDPSPFTLGYTDSLQTGVTSPGAPAAGAWKTDTTVDAFARATSFQRFLSGSNKQVFNFGYSSSLSPRPTSLTRGLNGAAASTTTFVYDDFAQLVETTVPESGPPGTPTPTRYEYDVGGRMIKKRQGTGTSAVRTDVYTYDSLGRTLTIDNDTEHPLTNCSGAVAGQAVQDVEYKYDNCNAPDLPTGFACNNALGRMTIARSILQCTGNGGSFVKRGRWYDYDALGRTARVAYAVVTGSTIGTPVIMDYTYKPSGKVERYRPPLSTIYGTKYTYSSTSGNVTTLETTAATPLSIMSNIDYLPFGPLKQADTASIQAAGSSTRKLRYLPTYRSDYALASLRWKYVHASGPWVPDIALIAQESLVRSPAGAIMNRYDDADIAASRIYRYDSLLRLVCEARGAGGWNPVDSDCQFAGGRTASIVTYNDGASASQPVDTRATQYIRTENGSYISPATETMTYAGGSTQLQGLSRGASTMVVGHDALGRRSFEYDSIDPVRSRRDYAYLPNGQLGTIEGRTPSNLIYGFSFRYDERGRPLTISSGVGGAVSDSYELFWDDADRLVSARITMPACRGSLAPPWGCTHGGYNVATWNYHYLGSTLVAATQTIGGQNKRYWAAGDERGLIYRLLNQNGGTVWQARWDANGARTIVGTMNEMWMPFGLPGHLLLEAMPIAQQAPDVGPTSNPGTEAFASNGTSAWTRSPLALNRWRAYDPFTASLLQPDPADAEGRLMPEGLVAFRSNSLLFQDPSGRESRSGPDMLLGSTLGRYVFDESCTEENRLDIIAAAGRAYRKLSECTIGACGHETSKRNLIARLVNGVRFVCKKPPSPRWYLADDGGFVDINYTAAGVAQQFVTRSLAVSTWPQEPKQRPGGRVTHMAMGVKQYEPDECMADTIAHEAYHDTIRRLPQTVFGSPPEKDLGYFEGPGTLRSVSEVLGPKEENSVAGAIGACKLCQ